MAALKFILSLSLGSVVVVIAGLYNSSFALEGAQFDSSWLLEIITYCLYYVVTLIGIFSGNLFKILSKKEVSLNDIHNR